MPASTTDVPGSSRPQSTIDLLELFWRRRSYLIGCVLVGIVLGLLYCGLAMPVYESTADVLVVRKRPQAVTGDHQYESGFEDYLATHLAVIASPLIVQRAIESSDLESLESFADLEDPEEELVDAILDDLEVESGSRDLGENADSIMTLAFRSSVPEDSPIVVKALLNSYEAFHQEVYSGMSDNTVSLIMQARDLLTSDLTKQEESYSSFRQASPLVSRGTDEVNPLQDRLTTIEEQRSDLLLQRAETERQLLALEQAKRDGDEYHELLALVSEFRQRASAEGSSSNVSTALESQLIQLVDDEQRLLEHYGPSHPHVVTTRQRIADTRRFLALPTAAHMPDSDAGQASEVSSPNSDPVAVYTQYLQQELKRLKISEDLLTDLYEHEHEAAKEHSIFQLQDERYHRSIERTEALYDVVVNRLQEASLVKDFGGFETRVIAPPRLGVKVGPSRRIVLPAAAFLGMLLGCTLALFVELWDGSFQSCEQIQQQLGLPVVGQIPRFEATPQADGTGVSRDPMLCSFFQPRSLPAESFRSLRTALYFHGPEETSSVIQVTGAGAQDGASTVAANLAISLAQTGKRVLLIDADLYVQRQYQMFGLNRPETGLAAVIQSDAEPGDVICPTSVTNLSLLPAGPLPAGPCELFTSSRFGDLIKLVRDRYDHVLIDTGPLVAGSDPCVIASQTDGVLLTLRLTRDSRLRAKQAKEMLDRLGVSMLGVVVNRVSNAKLNLHPVEPYDHLPTGDELSPDSRLQPTISAAG